MISVHFGRLCKDIFVGALYHLKRRKKDEGNSDRKDKTVKKKKRVKENERG